MNQLSLRLFLGLAGAALAVALFINFVHAVDAYKAVGFPAWQAWPAGLVPDIVIAAASTLLVADVRAGLGFRPLPVLLLVLGGLLSLGVNGWLAAGSPPHTWITVAMYLSPTLVVLAIAPLIEDAITGLISADDPESEATGSTETPVQAVAYVLGTPAIDQVAAVDVAAVRDMDTPEVPWTREYARLWAESFRLQHDRWPTPGEMVKAGPQRDSTWCEVSMRPLKRRESARVMSDVPETMGA
jgi:hypothetical protein